MHKTRSGRAFSPWLVNAEALSAPPSADFDFGQLLQAAIEREGACPAADARPIDDAASLLVDGAPEPERTLEGAYGSARSVARGGSSRCGSDEECQALPVCIPRDLPNDAPRAIKPPQPTPPPHTPSTPPPRASAARQPAATAPSVKAWKAARQKRRGKEKEARRNEARAQGACAAARAFLSRHLEAHEPHKTDYMVADMKHVATAYQGVRDDSPTKRLWTAQECVEVWGHVVKKWDGKTPMPILDGLGRVFGVCAGSPSDPDWDDVHREAARLIQSTGRECRFPKGCSAHRRGDFPALATGVSFGGGQKQPGNLVHPEADSRALSKLLESRAIRRLAGFASGALSLWCPRLHRYYCTTLSRLFQRHPLLRRNFKNSVFPFTTINFGPRTCCFPHTDANNLPYGLCAITALGSFDPALGGHLILWDLKTVVEFPPGSTILIPSATIRHSNTPIQKDETRYSFTQYAAGGLFRWVEHGFQTERARTVGWSRAQLEDDKAKGIQEYTLEFMAQQDLSDLCGMYFFAVARGVADRIVDRGHAEAKDKAQKKWRNNPDPDIREQRKVKDRLRKADPTLLTTNPAPCSKRDQAISTLQSLQQDQPGRASHSTESNGASRFGGLDDAGKEELSELASPIQHAKELSPPGSSATHCGAQCAAEDNLERKLSLVQRKYHEWSYADDWGSEQRWQRAFDVELEAAQAVSRVDTLSVLTYLREHCVEGRRLIRELKDFGGISEDTLHDVSLMKGLFLQTMGLYKRILAETIFIEFKLLAAQEYFAE
ncbi:hypothetical protein HWV62_23180 [Athelia sp. TMB]|nr:hypothetical protein HWV62_23180 [Athelia sp. TMB]